LDFNDEFERVDLNKFNMKVFELRERR